MPLGTATEVVEFKKPPSRMREPGTLGASPVSDSREKASASTSPAFSAATAASALSNETWVALGAVLLAVRKVAVLATPPMLHAGRIGGGDRGDLACRADQVGALQQVIGVAEVDEFLALLVDRQERDVPFVVGGRILDFAGAVVGDQFGRHAELLGERAAQDDGDAAIIAGVVLDGELRGRRGRNRDGDAQFSGRGKLSRRHWALTRVSEEILASGEVYAEFAGGPRRVARRCASARTTTNVASHDQRAP